MMLSIRGRFSMSIFDIFSFKKEASKVFTKENFAHIMETARTAIIKRASINVNRSCMTITLRAAFCFLMNERSEKKMRPTYPKRYGTCEIFCVTA